MSNSIDQHLGRNLKSARENGGLSLGDLALRSEIQEVRIEAIERGEERALASELFRLANALGISMAQIFEGL